MKQIIAWLNANKVVLIGCLTSAFAIIQQVSGQQAVDYKAVGLAIAAAVASYLAKNLRGQWVSIMGIAGNMIVLISTQYQAHEPISWMQVIMQVMTGFIAIVAPPAKSISYERSDVIQEAKQDAKAIDADKGVSVPAGGIKKQ